MAKVPTVFVEGRQDSLEGVFRQLGWIIAPVCDEDVDIVVLMGGNDINPEWYHRKRHPNTSIPNHPFDKQTARLIDFATERGLDLIGICRGAQFINAIMGGDMWQHVNNHGGGHEVLDLETEEVYYTNSIHHQMMIPHSTGHLIAVTLDRVTSRAERVDANGKILIADNSPKDPVVEAEVIWYPKFSALCFQAHPEYDHKSGTTRQYFYNLLQRKYPQYDYSRLGEAA